MRTAPESPHERCVQGDVVWSNIKRTMAISVRHILIVIEHKWWSKVVVLPYFSFLWDHLTINQQDLLAKGASCPLSIGKLVFMVPSKPFP